MKIYITTCDKRANYAKKMKEMLADCPYEYFFVYGQGNTNKVEPFIEVDVVEAYENLPEKTFCLVERFMKDYPDETLLKMDDDVFVDLEKLKKYDSLTEDYVGYFHDYETSQYGAIFHLYKIKNPAFRIEKKCFKLQYAEGAMYFLSRKACSKVLADGRDFYKNTPETYLGEDVHVGMSLEDEIITKKNIKFHSELGYEITEDLMSVHPVNLIVFDKLKAAKSNGDKLKVLADYNFINDNMLRLKYLAKVEPVVKTN